ncbi:MULTISPECIES: BON domain-containing protein [Methylobacillus]|uniref:Transport-associated protein n=1 Tax=Methylobacillus flagellatus (strain ATCC 51484 / DSM 6875 / VKM B-1610 / KT) TaxID=265072 RepID=Q1GXL2_METFK|nr:MULTISPECIES: BON domain-containing protein [Methylobacillus]ABE48281.1 transport-associated protein [Methylobacillus flagellatus KT]MPS47424.1 BON domain-containing protein [Methylobacillus sp.]
MKVELKSLVLIGALMMPIASIAAEGDSIETKLSDSVITTKVKAAFAKDKLVSATDIKVETDSDGLVQLSGTAKSKEEAKRAVELTKAVKGVTGVKDDIVVP